jgi:hypothetical protein
MRLCQPCLKSLLISYRRLLKSKRTLCTVENRFSLTALSELRCYAFLSPVWNTYKRITSNYNSPCCLVSDIGLLWKAGIATHYGLDGPVIESLWGRDFPHPSRPALGPTQPPVQEVPSLFPGDKSTEAWRRPLTRHLAPKLKKE